MTDDTLQDIQIMLAHQERQIQDMSDLINLQRKEIDILKARLDKTQRKIVEMEHGAGDGKDAAMSVTEQALRDKPPHY